jgi:L-malate glycosyltransferase
MRVLFVLEDLLTGGAQIHALDLCARLRVRGFATEVVILGAEAAPALAARAGASLSRLDQRGLRHPAEWGRLGRALAARQPDLVVSVNQVAGCVVGTARITGRLRAPAVAICHTSAVRSWAGRARTAGFFAAARAHQALVFVSKGQRRYWRRRGLSAPRTAMIHNGVDLRPAAAPLARAEREAARRELGLDADLPTFGAAAMFRREKNLGQVVEAAGRLKAHGTPVQLLLVGDGPERRAVQARAEALGLGPLVRFPGEQADVAPYLRAMDAGVLCSTSVETLPLFGLEIMATGAPLIAPAVGGLPELVAHGRDGLIFRPGDTDGLVGALRLCCEPGARDQMGGEAFAKAQSFGADEMADRYAELFRQVQSAR